MSTATSRLDTLLDHYAQTHRNPTNRRIHLACVPVIVLSTVGLGWGVHLGWVSDAPRAHLVNLGTLGSLAALVYYARFGWRPALWNLALLALCNAVAAALVAIGAPLVAAMAALWVAAWIAQLVGHKEEGAKPSFTEDLVFLLIGPLFVLEELGFAVRSRADAAA